MPDDMLEDAITIAKKSLDEHDFESEGVEVSIFIGFIIHRLRDLLRSIWMISGSPTGMYS